MEEILASIRRIIADDDAVKTVQAAPEPAKPVPPPAPVAPPLEAAAPPVRMQVPEPVAPVEEVEDQAADILDLTESMTSRALSEPPAAPEPPSGAPQFRKIDGFSDVGFDDAEQRPVAPKPVARESAARESMPRESMAPAVAREPIERLLSSTTSAAVDSAFNSLAQTVLVQNARTLEDLVREMLRPMLKSWLDDNLPGMVERLVRAEIERVARGH